MRKRSTSQQPMMAVPIAHLQQLTAIKEAMQEFMLPLTRELLKATAYDDGHEHVALGVEALLAAMESPMDYLRRCREGMLNDLDGYRCDHCGGAFHRRDIPPMADIEGWIPLFMACDGCGFVLTYSQFMAYVQADCRKRARIIEEEGVAEVPTYACSWCGRPSIGLVNGVCLRCRAENARRPKEELPQ